jgi:hypothetical protein
MKSIDEGPGKEGGTNDKKPRVGAVANGDTYNGPFAFRQVHLDLMVDLVVVNHLLHMGMALVLT